MTANCTQHSISQMSIAEKCSIMFIYIYIYVFLSTHKHTFTNNYINI